MEWVDSTIGAVCDQGGGVVKTGPFGSQLHQSDYEEEGIPVVMPKDIIDSYIGDSTIARVSEDHVNRLSKHKLSEGDIVYGRRGDIGRQALVRKENVGWLCGTGCLRITLGDAPVDSYFLHLYLRQPDVIKWISNQAIGATMPNLNTSILREIPIRYPENYEYQKKLSKVISTYDDLIENNNRRIANLEEMAQSLYREWFVKFRFPDNEKTKFIDSQLGKIPEGWEIHKVNEIIKRRRAGTVYKQKDVDITGAVPVIDQSRSEVLGYHSNEPDHMASSNEPIAIFGDHTCKMQLVVEPFSVGPNVVPFEPKIDRQLQYIFFLVNSLISTQEYKRHWTELNQKVVTVADKDTVAKYSDFVSPLLKKINSLRRINIILSRQHDLILPKLISGTLELQ